MIVTSTSVPQQVRYLADERRVVLGFPLLQQGMGIGARAKSQAVPGVVDIVPDNIGDNLGVR